MEATTSAHTLDRYFALSNTAGQDSGDFEELLSLFAPDATLVSGLGEPASGTTAIAAFFRTFFARNTELHHVWNTRSTGVETFAVDWAVAGRHKDGAVFAISGTDTARLDDQGKICSLQVTVNH
ncbi:MAG: nuclear transport factor 2 family protein [Propionibacterium sp.]|nr:nuclear transport factor 2 family protein [Propionibacterium sp.]